ncbi:pilus assembly protein [Vibrio sp. SCSIO 43140]|uniref:TadE family protein n=1 Tax=Vibrio sp. SCSIO 43140 TaxID=2819100 RepID=UPI002074B463|nr:TadE family protein [Vibrio sp. SCSIO 43140]USD61764.1 pilus assembly protein [Vibrio sp. SCSIO 43140]
MKGFKKQLGVTAVEFALGAIVLMFSTFAIFEICYRIYVINMTEYALRETIRNTKIFQGSGIHEQYESRFQALISDDSNLWHFLIDEDKFSLDGKYFPSYRDFINNVGYSKQDLNFNYDLAEITVTYQYEPILWVYGAQAVDISRTMVLNLEHEGWADETE